jgi:hypothetical protein
MRQHRRASIVIEVIVTVAAVIVAGGFFGSAHADGTPIAGPDHVEGLCHSWTESPCLLRVCGTLHNAQSGSALVGKRLRFVAGGNLICSSTTDETGHASCLGIVQSGRTVAESGYRIHFDGDGRFDAQSAAALSIVKLGSR